MTAGHPFLPRRRLALLGAALLGAAKWPGPAAAEPFPDRPIRMVIAGPAGAGAIDLVPRLIADPMAEALGQPVVAENRPGAGGILAAEAVARAPPDGHTLLVGSVSHIVYAFVMAGRPPLDPFVDFSPAARLTIDHWLIVVPPMLGAATLAEFVAAARARPQGLNYAVPGIGTSQHIQGERVRRRLGVEATAVPYRGDTVPDLIAGRLDFAVLPSPQLAPHVAAGRLHGLAVLSEERLPALPEVPTIAEAGYPDLRYNAGISLFATGGTPEPVVARLNAEVNAALRLPTVRARFAALGLETPQTTLAEAAAFLRRLLAVQDGMSTEIFGKAR
jgi:tripartite-type tricarboxylate transporter receptor subunit TctC